jgi:hypothetical protein
MVGQASVLFVCLGNICRSPLAEGARAAAAHAGLSVVVDSAGTGGWHIGEPPDTGTGAAALHGVDISAQRGRQVERADFERFSIYLRWMAPIWPICGGWLHRARRPGCGCCWIWCPGARGNR